KHLRIRVPDRASSNHLHLNLFYRVLLDIHHVPKNRHVKRLSKAPLHDDAGSCGGPFSYIKYPVTSRSTSALPAEASLRKTVTLKVGSLDRGTIAPFASATSPVSQLSVETVGLGKR